MTGFIPTIRRKLPGLAWRKPANDDLITLKGRVIHTGWGLTGPVTQTIETDSKLVPLVKLIGSTYAYFCGNCSKTIWEQELQLLQGDGIRSALVNGQRCPFCESFILPLQPGDKVRCHYRFSPSGNWGSWWAERWEW